MEYGVFVQSQYELAPVDPVDPVEYGVFVQSQYELAPVDPVDPVEPVGSHT
jgi:hypothetical protein